MFRKIISNLSYSPALVESLSRLAVGFKKDERLRRMGVFFLLPAIVIQVFILSFPPEQSNATNQQGALYGGFSSFDDFIAHYDQNDRHIRDILTAIGITRYDITQTKKTTFNLANTYRVSLADATTTDADMAFSYATSGDATHPGMQTAYLTELPHSAVKNTTVYASKSNSSRWFGINLSNGDVLLQDPPAGTGIHDTCPITLPSPKSKCSDFYQQSAFNQTKSTPASQTAADEDDHILYNFTIRNPKTAEKPLSIPFAVSLYDSLEYASMLESGGGVFDKKRGTVIWPDITLQPGQSVTHTVVLKVLHTVPATGTGVSNPLSYDCTMTSVLATTKLSLLVQCPPVKHIEKATSQLPPLSGTLIIVEVTSILSILYFYFRSRQIKEEIRLVRKDINAGTID